MMHIQAVNYTTNNNNTNSKENHHNPIPLNNKKRQVSDELQCLETDNLPLLTTQEFKLRNLLLLSFNNGTSFFPLLSVKMQIHTILLLTLLFNLKARIIYS